MRQLIMLVVGAFTLAAPVSAAVLEQVLVSARKREEPALGVPMQISAFSAGDVDAKLLRGLDDYVELTPSLQRLRNGNDTETLLLIRGLGNIGASESSVGYFVDGNYRAAGSFATEQLFDIDRIEVLHGPQGVLYGKSTIGGAINIVPNAPVFRYESSLSVSAATESAYRLDAMANAVLIPGQVAGRLALVYEDFGGFFTNHFLNEPVDDNRQLAARARLLWTPTQTLNVNLTAHWRDQDQHAFALRRVNGPRDYRGGGFNRNASNDARINNHGVDLGIGLSLESVLLSSRTSWTNSTEYGVVDLDYQIIPALAGIRDQERQEVAQEFRVQSVGNSRLQWQAGAYLYFLREDFTQVLRAGTANGPSLVSQQSRQRARTLSAFGQVQFDLLPMLNLDAGLRFDHDQRRLSSVAVSAQDEFSNLSAHVAGTWSVNQRTALYARISRMFRPGGFNRGIAAPFDEESTTVYELGIKARPSQSIQFDAAVFWNRVQSAQNIVSDRLTLVETTANKGNAEIQGIEFRFLAKPHESLDIDVSGTWLHHEYDNFRALRFGPQGLAEIDFSGGHLQWVADYQLTSQIAYEKPMQLSSTPVRASARFAASVLGPFAWDEFNSAYSKRRTVLNLNLGVAAHRWQLQLFADNLTDERFFTNYVPAFRFPLASSDLAAPGPRRQFGIRATVRFN